MLALVVEIVPSMDDVLVIDFVEQLALLMVDRDGQVESTQAVLSATLNELHRVQRENERLRERLIDIRRRGA